jgi:hypothetical protein
MRGSCCCSSCNFAVISGEELDTDSRWSSSCCGVAVFGSALSHNITQQQQRPGGNAVRRPHIQHMLSKMPVNEQQHHSADTPY